MVRVANFISLDLYTVGFESYWGLKIFLVRKPSRWLMQGW